MKFLHVLPPYSIHPYAVIHFIKDNFPKDEHSFLVMGSLNWCMKNNNRLLAFSDLIYFPEAKNTRIGRYRQLRYCLHLFQQAEHIIWHSYFNLKGFQMMILFSCKAVLEKSVWIEHYLDLYKWSWTPHNIKSHILWKLHRKMRSKVPFIGLTSFPDREEWVRQFGENTGTVFFDTPSPLLSQHLRELKEYMTHPKIHGRPVFLIGYDWLSYNEHIRLADLLQPFADDDFSIVLPMNFAMPYEYGQKGTTKYRGEVKRYIDMTLKMRSALLTRSSVLPKSYFMVIGATDVAIFGGERPLKFDLLYYLLLMGKKVFLPADQPLFHYLREQGVSVYDTNSIPKMDYQELISPPEPHKTDWLEKMTYGTGMVEKWAAMFRYLQGED